jgi:prolipoprotein diacylglyceryltransferase
MRTLKRILIALLIALTSIFIGGIIGATTNMVNGLVSPYYFKAIMQWEFDDVWIASVAQGIFEGLLYGISFSVIFTIAFEIITKGQGSFKFGFSQLVKVIAVTLICWVLGGLVAILLNSISPEIYKSHFPQTPYEKIERLKFAWVGGSIWGGIIGGCLSLFLGVIFLKNAWRAVSLKATV